MNVIKYLLRHIFGWEIREGKLQLGYYALKDIEKLHLTLDEVEDVFRHGKKVTSIIQRFQHYTISVGYKWNDAKKCYEITSVRKYENTF